MGRSAAALARLQLLGRVQLRTAAGREITPRSAKARGVLAYLALAPAGTAPRAKVAALLWGDSMTAMASLRQAVKEIRTGFGTAALEGFVADHHELHLDLSRIWVDVLHLDDLVAELETADLTGSVWARGLLEDETIRAGGFEDWLVVEQARCRQQLANVLGRRVERALAQGRHEVARHGAEALIMLDPVDEDAYRTLMRCAAGAGDVAGAIRGYEACRAALARDLDVPPSAETEHLLRNLRSTPPPGPGPVAVTPPRRGGHASLTVGFEPTPANDSVDQTLGFALASGLREALSKIRWLWVTDHVAYVASGMAQDQPYMPKYDVRVGLLRGGKRVRMTIELRSGDGGRILWADHCDRPLGDDLFSLVDDLASALAGRIDREVELAEIIRVAQKPEEALTAFERVLRAIPLIFELTPQSFDKAGRMLLDAQGADPYDATIYAWRAFWYSINFGQAWVRDPEAAHAEVDFLVRRAIELDPKNALAHAVAGHIAAYLKHDYNHALSLFDRSLKLDPSSAYAWDSSAVTLSYVGRADEALQQLQRASPIWQQHPDPYYFRTTSCIASLLAGKPREAAVLGRDAVRENPHFQAAYRPLIASLGLTGQVAEAQEYLHKLKVQHPDFSIGWFKEHYPPLHGAGKVYYFEGLRKAGVSE